MFPDKLWSCSCCGMVIYAENSLGRHEIECLQISCGFGTAYTLDCVSIGFEVCGQCLKKWIDSFKQPPPPLK